MTDWEYDFDRLWYVGLNQGRDKVEEEDVYISVYCCPEDTNYPWRWYVESGYVVVRRGVSRTRHEAIAAAIATMPEVEAKGSRLEP